MKNHSKVIAALAVVAIGALAAAPSAPATAQGNGAVTITLDPATPIAWESFVVDVGATDCDPGSTELSVEVLLQQGRTDAISLATVTSGAIPLDGTGSGTGSVNVDIAYPGSWSVQVTGCGTGNPDASKGFEIAAPSDFVLTATPAAPIVVGVPFDVALKGTACPGPEVQWLVGMSNGFGYDAYAQGTAQVFEGVSTADATGTVPADHPPAVVPGTAPTVSAVGVCVINGFDVYYPAVALPLAEATAPPVNAPVANPQFTG